MRAYWLRIVTAWFLLMAAGRMVKDAERLLQATRTAEPEPVTEDDVQDAIAEDLNGHAVTPVTPLVERAN